MNYTALSGFFAAAMVIYLGVFEQSSQPTLFLDSHAIILVLGGTTAAALIAFPIQSLLRIPKMLFYSVIFKAKRDHRELVNEMVLTASAFQLDPRSLSGRRATHPFLSEGYKIIEEGSIDTADLRDILNRRIKYFRKAYLDDAKLLTSLAKFPPAFGLLGATTGMISMMTNLGHGGQETIGPSMAVALVATFWGIAIANLILLPLADYATKAANDDTFTRQLIIEGLVLIKQKQPETTVAEKLNSYLPLDDRLHLVDFEKRKTLRKAA